MIYESRPNVTTDLAGLAFKSGNAVVLKGGSEAFNSNQILVRLIHYVLKNHGVSSDLLYLINPKHNWQEVLLNAHGLVDVIIPRGSGRLIEWVRQNSRVPVIETGAGVCHTFVDDSADPKMAAEIIYNAKTQRPNVCNALDTLVIHHKIIDQLLPLMAEKLRTQQVKIFADAASYQSLKACYSKELLRFCAGTDKACPYGVEFLSLTMSIKTVKNFQQGLAFIKKYTSEHSETILSKHTSHIRQFLREIDAATVYSNASTRFTDGGEFGMGAEVGISTQKLHARGPMGLESLTTYKWVVMNSGQTRK